MVKVPVSHVFEAMDKSLATSWYTLQPRKKAKNKDCVNTVYSRLKFFYDMCGVG
ncbi:C2 and GRAM domain-containing At1g03370 [Olea europaea subsp. europaea]|uniref:C2 and GRAM domain-containing At1g03370 n=1 Tax=Olea europaea subsp. europaea TaxID=158383 RepID=A0A8S0UM81_OLEEU|nr:C2 and GRAM domain-containing At1g03370 [Olea europaea subsp. europaea]